MNGRGNPLLILNSCTSAVLFGGDKERGFLLIYFIFWWLQWPPAVPSHPLRCLSDGFQFFSPSRSCLQCTPSCGPGYRHRVVLCKSGESSDTLPESKCSKHSRPTSRVRCNLKRCPPPQWVAGPWGEVRHQILGRPVYFEKSFLL